DNPERLAVFVELELHFVVAEVYRAFLVSFRPELSGNVPQDAEFGAKVSSARSNTRLRSLRRQRVLRRAPIQYFLCFFVGEALVRVYYRALEAALQHLAILVHLENSRKGEAVRSLNERAHVARELVREHGDRRVDEVDRGAALLHLAVQSHPWAHEEGRVGDMHADFIGAVAQIFDRERVVEVLGIGRVDGKGSLVSKIAARERFARDRVLVLFFDLLRFGSDVCGEVDRETVLEDDRVHLGAVRAGDPDVLDDRAGGIFAACERLELHEHLFAFGNFRQAHELDGLIKTLVGGYRDVVLALALHGRDARFLRAAHDLHDRALRAGEEAFDLDLDFVAV